MSEIKKSMCLSMAGILLIIASFFCLMSGMFMVYLLSTPPTSFSVFVPYYLVGCIFEFWGFFTGLTGGFFSIKRNYFPIALMGAIFAVAAGCIALLVYVGIVTLILSVVGLVFISISCREFGN